MPLIRLSYGRGVTLITLVRHGQTDWNLARRIQGATDIPLNETGREDARNAAALLSADTHHQVCASPLVRAQETAQIIAQTLGLDEPELHPELRERSFGEAEGIPVAEYMERYGTWHAPVPGSETLAEVGERAMQAIERIVRRSRRRSAPAAESIVIVTHGGLIRAVLERVSGGTLPREGQLITNGSTHRFAYEGNALRSLETYDPVAQ